MCRRAVGQAPGLTGLPNVAFVAGQAPSRGLLRQKRENGQIGETNTELNAVNRSEQMLYIKGLQV